MAFPKQEYWSGLLFPSLGNLPNAGKPVSPVSPALVGGFFTTEPPGKLSVHCRRCQFQFLPYWEGNMNKWKSPGRTVIFLTGWVLFSSGWCGSKLVVKKNPRDRERERGRERGKEERGRKGGREEGRKERKRKKERREKQGRDGKIKALICSLVNVQGVNPTMTDFWLSAV